MSFEEFFPETFDHFDKVGFADVLDVASPPVWSPAIHEEFTPTFRKSIRHALLAAKHCPLVHIATIDALGLLEAEDVEIVGGVAYVQSTETMEEDIVLYEVDSDGEMLTEYKESPLPFIVPSGAFPPKTTSPAAHREYLTHAQVNQVLLCTYPEVFGNYPRKRAFYRQNRRITMDMELVQSDNEQPSDDEQPLEEPSDNEQEQPTQRRRIQ